MTETADSPSATYGVHSEVGRLRKVLVCAPGLAHRRLTPTNAGELLFDDVLELTMHLARGMALQKLLRSDDSARRRLFELWRELAAAALRGDS